MIREGHDDALDREAAIRELVSALERIADPTNHHYKPDYVRPEVIARVALAIWEQGGYA